MDGLLFLDGSESEIEADSIDPSDLHRLAGITGAGGEIRHVPFREDVSRIIRALVLLRLSDRDLFADLFREEFICETGEVVDSVPLVAYLAQRLPGLTEDEILAADLLRWFRSTLWVTDRPGWNAAAPGALSFNEVEEIVQESAENGTPVDSREAMRRLRERREEEACDPWIVSRVRRLAETKAVAILASAGVPVGTAKIVPATARARNDRCLPSPLE